MEKNLNNNEEEKLNQEMIDGSENPAVVLEGNTSVFDKGQERFDAISNKVSAIKEGTIGFFKKAGSKIGNFFKKTAVGALAMPEIIGEGAERYDKMVTKGIYSAVDGVKSGVNYVEKKAEQYGDMVDGGVNSAIDGAKSGINYVGEKINQGLDAYDRKIDQGFNWAERKVDNTKAFINEGIELGKDAAFYLGNKSAEGLQNLGNSISNRYNSIVEFGANSINGAKEAILEKKKQFNDWKNEVRKQRLAKELEKSISGVSSEIDSNRSEMEKRAQNLQILNNRLNELIEAKNGLFAQPQAVAA